MLVEAIARLQNSMKKYSRVNGRAQQITFHVFDPKLVEVFLNLGIVTNGTWKAQRRKPKTG